MAPETRKLFPDLFSGWYAEYDSSMYGKPLIIGETESCQLYVSPKLTQPQYIADIRSKFDTDISPTFPMDIKALNYFDARGNYNPEHQFCNWVFSNGSGQGLSTWIGLGQDSMFSPFISGT